MSLTRRLQVLVRDEQWDALEREAQRAGSSVGAVVREAIDERLAPGRTGVAGGAGARLLASPPMPVGEPDELEGEIAELSARWPPA